MPWGAISTGSSCSASRRGWGIAMSPYEHCSRSGAGCATERPGDDRPVRAIGPNWNLHSVGRPFAAMQSLHQLANGANRTP